MKVRFVTLGCKLNFAESSALGKELLLRGHQRASLSDVPDVCVVNTCSVTDAADHKDRQTINQLHRKYPNAIIIVTGCYAQLQPQQIAQIEGVDYVLRVMNCFFAPMFRDAELTALGISFTGLFGVALALVWVEGERRWTGWRKVLS